MRWPECWPSSMPKIASVNPLRSTRGFDSTKRPISSIVARPFFSVINFLPYGVSIFAQCGFNPLREPYRAIRRVYAGLRIQLNRAIYPCPRYFFRVVCGLRLAFSPLDLRRNARAFTFAQNRHRDFCKDLSRVFIEG